MFTFFNSESFRKAIKYQVKTKDNGDIYVEEIRIVDGALGIHKFIDKTSDIDLPTIVDKSAPIVNRFLK